MVQCSSWPASRITTGGTNGDDRTPMATTGTERTMTSAVMVNESRSGIVRVTLDHSVAGNRLDLPTTTAIMEGLDLAECAAGAGVFVLDATGETFCSGLALNSVDGQEWRPLVVAIGRLLARLAESALVTVAVVDGAAEGGGVGLAASCDRVIAGPRVSFRMTEVLLGLVPALVLPVVARRTGAHRAYSLALTAEQVSSRAAYELGLADVSCADPDSELRRTLRRLRAADTAALRALKRYYAELPDLGLSVHGGVPAVLEERLADPGTHARLRLLRSAGWAQ